MKLQRRRAVPAAVAVVLLALTGCDQSPGVAATVDGSTISTHDVELMTQVLCVDRARATKQGQPAQAAVSTVREQALNTLITSELDRKFAAEKQLPSSEALVSQQLAGFEPLFAAIPAEDRAATRKLVRDYFRGEIQLQQLGAAVLQQQGKQVDGQSALKEGLAQRKDFAEKQQIEVNPRFQTSGPGHVDGSQSLSVPVSDFAKSAAAATPDPTWVAGLPKNQRCG